MSDIDEIKSRLNVVDVVGTYVPSLKKAGRYYKGLCPFHHEKTPSFMVNPDTQSYKCFGCGEGGDVISFIEKMERVDFGEALKIAAERAGYELKHNQSPTDTKLKQQKERNIAANILTAKFYNYLLKTHKLGKTGRDYAQKRGIRIQEIDKFLIGYAPSGSHLLQFLTQKGFNKQELEQFGLIVERNGNYIDKFRDRLMLSVFNMKGEVIGFSGRIVTPNELAPKYLNSPETVVYKKAEILMGLFQAKDAAREKKFLILEEGNIDLLSSHSVGIENIVATGGTALTVNQCKLIQRYADTVYFCFDTDGPGRKALLKGIEICESIGLPHKALDIGTYQDPDAMIQKEPQKWAEVIAQPQNTVSFLLKIYQQDLDLGSADGKSTYRDRAVQLLRLLKDEVQLAHFVNEVALLTGVSQEVISKEVSKTGSVSYTSRYEEKEDISHAIPTPAAAPIKPKAYSPKEIYLLCLLVQLKGKAGFEVNPDIFSDTNTKGIFKLLAENNWDSSAAKMISELNQNLAELLMRLEAVSMDNITNIEQECSKVYNTLYIDFLRSQIRNLRLKLQQNSDDEKALADLSYFSLQLKQLTQE